VKFYIGAVVEQADHIYATVVVAMAVLVVAVVELLTLFRVLVQD
jgi:hypothetical protein